MLGHMFVVAGLLVVIGGGGIVAQFADAPFGWGHTTYLHWQSNTNNLHITRGVHWFLTWTCYVTLCLAPQAAGGASGQALLRSLMQNCQALHHPP